MKRSKYNTVKKRLSEMHKSCREQNKPSVIFVYPATKGGHYTVDVQYANGSAPNAIDCDSEEAAFKYIESIRQRYENERITVIYDDIEDWED